MVSAGRLRTTSRSDVGLPPALVLFCAAVLTIALYAPTLAHPYVYQDDHYAYTVAPSVVHGISLVLHLLNGLLLYLIVREFAWRHAEWIVALFWVHPLNVEAIAYGAAQSEPIILAGVLLAVWCIQQRLWWMTAGPVLVLSATKLKALPSFLAGSESARVVADGVSWLQWWQWEAVACWRLVKLWALPLGLSIDHDSVHVAAAWQWAALVSLPIAVIAVAWAWPAARWPVCWMVIFLAPRFLVRIPLSILNEHHFYPSTAALAVLTVKAYGHR